MKSGVPTMPVPVKFGSRLHRFGDTKVGEEWVVVLIEQNVAGFYVAVQHAVLVGEVEGVGDGRENANGFTDRERTVLEFVGQRAVAHKRHDDIRHIVGVAEIIQRQNREMG